jgi:hypothetical protein
MEQKKKKKRNSGDSSKVVSYMPLQNASAAELSCHRQKGLSEFTYMIVIWDELKRGEWDYCCNG